MSNTDPEQAKKARRALGALMSDAQTLGLFSLMVIGLGVVVVAMQSGGQWGPPLLWALGCLAVGALAGFVFGIPRVQQDAPGDQPADGTAPAAVTPITRRKYKLLANTNLEQISDWLTKIIVGVGLVESKQLPGYLGRLARFVGPAIHGPDTGGAANVFALAITMHFAVWGFICAYLLTRVYLTGTFFRAEGLEENPDPNARTTATNAPRTDAPPPNPVP